jgi:hypothetical protein
LKSPGRELQRSDSYSQHLAGKFFPPDAGGEEEFKRKLHQGELIAEAVALSKGKTDEKHQLKRSNSHTSFGGSLLMGWGFGLDIDKVNLIPATEAKKVVKKVFIKQTPDMIVRPNKVSKSKPFNFARPKTAQMSETARKVAANSRVLSAALNSARRIEGKVTDRDILSNRGIVADRPYTHHCATTKSGRNTPYRPFTSHDSRLAKSTRPFTAVDAKSNSKKTF